MPRALRASALSGSSSMARWYSPSASGMRPPCCACTPRLKWISELARSFSVGTCLQPVRRRNANTRGQARETRSMRGTRGLGDSERGEKAAQGGGGVALLLDLLRGGRHLPRIPEEDGERLEQVLLRRLRHGAPVRVVHHEAHGLDEGQRLGLLAQVLLEARVALAGDIHRAV